MPESRFSSIEVVRAILNGDLERFDSFLRSGLDVNTVAQGDRWNFLHRALVPVERTAHPEMIQHLVNLGVDVNARDRYWNTPLHYAARVRNLRAMGILLDAGAEVNPKNKDGLTPLHLALMAAPMDVRVVELLVSRGADPDYDDGGLRRLVAECADPASREIIRLFDQHRLNPCQEELS